MTLSIDTTDNKQMIIGLRGATGKDLVLKKIPADFNQAEKLLSSIMKVLAGRKADLKKIKRIEVANKGGSFTSLRIGVVTANALGFALNIPVEGEGGGTAKKTGDLLLDFDVVEPVYGREPNITMKKG